MINKKYLVLGLLVCLCLSGCSKNSSIQSSDSFGDVEESSSLVESSEFSIEDPNFELPTKSHKEIQSELDNSIKVAQESLSELESVENSKFVVSDAKSNKNIDIREIEEEEVSKIIDDIKFRKYSSIDEVNNYVDSKFNSYSNEVKLVVKETLKESWDYWESEHKKMDLEKPWTEEELLENPLRRDYTREEYEEIEKKMHEMGQEIGGQGLKDIMSGD